MAINLVPFRPVAVRACATGGQLKPDTHSRKNSSSNWWTPLFGWSSDPDYIEPSDNSSSSKADLESKSGSDRDPKAAASRSRFAPGTFTEEKARRLRMMTTDTAAFHDAMYHSAIARRLASDFPERSDL